MKKQMKKIVVLAVAAVLSAAGMHAQESYKRNEIAVSYGLLSNSQWLDVFEKVLTAPLHTKVKTTNDHFIGPVTLEYMYHPKEWLAVGGDFIYGHNVCDLHEDGKHIGKAKNSYITVMPAVKFDWLRRKHFGMYSKVAAGVTFRHETDESVNRNNSATHFNFQITPVAIEAGSESVRGFLEVGLGEQGVLAAGVRCKF